MSKTCKRCSKRCYGEYCFQHKPRKAIPKQSDKEKEYQVWKEEVARPFVIERDGVFCQCPGGCNKLGTDLEHEEGKGSHPERKRDLTNLRLFCRYPCHDFKTNEILCLH